jgi:hypothetical protein
MADMTEPTNHGTEPHSDDAEMARVVEALEDSRYDWRTVEGVSRVAALPPARVIEILRTHPDTFMQSAVPDPQGRPLFTTRRHYRQTHSSLDRLKSIFRAG